MDSIDDVVDSEEIPFSGLSLDQFLFLMEKMKDSPYSNDTFRELHGICMNILESGGIPSKNLHNKIGTEYTFKSTEANIEINLRYSKWFLNDELEIRYKESNMPDLDESVSYLNLIRKRPAISMPSSDQDYLNVAQRTKRKTGNIFSGLFQYNPIGVNINNPIGVIMNFWWTYDYRTLAIDEEERKEYLTIVDQFRDDPTFLEYFTRLFKASVDIVSEKGKSEPGKGILDTILSNIFGRFSIPDKEYRHIFGKSEVGIKFRNGFISDQNVEIDLKREDGSYSYI
ncbi:hypothetical protein CMO94_01830 [Candidatus Woesearchaeota archaeon]|jgi:hypothetical protein|nr:hypothetical protein [Candidatus Woesearchaeota archaeon]MDP7244499.1 hypothetical protein [Flavobacteriales bacterium]